MRVSHKLIVVIVLISLVALLLPASFARADEIVTFPDPNLETAIREAIGKPAGDIYQSDLVGLTVLDASGRNIANVTGLDYCTNLLSLHLANNEIGNISPLSNLTSLTSLWLDWNQISDISPLENLTNLTVLGVGANNQISDISPLSNLTSLTHLHLATNQISDISPLSNLTSLTYLNLYANQISDVFPLVDNEGLSAGDLIELRFNPLSCEAYSILIPLLEGRGVVVLYDPPPPTFYATMDFDPDTLNLRSRGEFVTVYIEPPEGYDISQIDAASIKLNGIVPALAKPTEVDDYDSDGIADLMVKFDRTSVQDILTVGKQVEVAITGAVAAICFECSDSIRVID